MSYLVSTTGNIEEVLLTDLVDRKTNLPFNWKLRHKTVALDLLDRATEQSIIDSFQSGDIFNAIQNIYLKKVYPLDELQDDAVKAFQDDSVSGTLIDKISFDGNISGTELIEVGNDKKLKIFVDALVKASQNDTNFGSLIEKLFEGNNITIDSYDDNGIEKIRIGTINLEPETYQTKIDTNDNTPNFLGVKLKAGTNIQINSIIDETDNDIQKLQITFIPNLPNGATGVTSNTGDNTNKLATNAFVLGNSIGAYKSIAKQSIFSTSQNVVWVNALTLTTALLPQNLTFLLNWYFQINYTQTNSTPQVRLVIDGDVNNAIILYRRKVRDTDSQMLLPVNGFHDFSFASDNISHTFTIQIISGASNQTFTLNDIKMTFYKF